MAVAVLVLSGIDPTLRDLATAALSCDLPDAVVLRYPPVPGTWSTCAVRDDALATAAALARQGAAHVIVALPPGMTPVPLALGVQYAGAPLTLAASACVFDPATLAVDAAALVRQCETADLLLSVGAMSDRTIALLDHLAGPAPTRCDLYALDAAAAMQRRRPPEWASRGDLRLAEPTGAPDRDGTWTLDLSALTALDPLRLLQCYDDLRRGQIRGRGYFWLPDRPAVQYGWDNLGGQVRIDVLDLWAEPPHTRLVITGTDDSAPRLRAAFDTVTTHERAGVAR